MTESLVINTNDVDCLSFAEVLDLQELCDRCMGNMDLVQRVLDKFEQRLPDELAELERVLELSDTDKIALVAHRIKGNSSNISAASLQKAAAEIEELSRAGELEKIHSRLPNLREQWRRYIDCRTTILSSAFNDGGFNDAAAVSSHAENTEEIS